jgi:replicative DNA helicase
MSTTTTTARGRFTTAADVLDGWHDDLMSGKPPTFYRVGVGELGRLEVGPGLVTLIGGAPGAGKTAFTMQLVLEALRLTPTLRALVCNIEMPPTVLLDRQLARLSGVDLTSIRNRRLTAEHADRIDQGVCTLSSVADRLCFVRPPFDLGNVAAAADDFGASLLVLDYIQRIAPPGDHEHDRGRVNRSMTHLREFADASVAVIVISAVGRSKDAQGRSSYAGEGLNLASFRESSELEFGADDAFILHPDDPTGDGDLMRLRHLKSRHGECRDLLLRFDRARQSFTPEPTTGTPTRTTAADKGKLRAKLADLWKRTPAAGEGGDDE